MGLTAKEETNVSLAILTSLEHLTQYKLELRKSGVRLDAARKNLNEAEEEYYKASSQCRDAEKELLFLADTITDRALELVGEEQS